jgi:2-aminoadipate transaminase
VKWDSLFAQSSHSTIGLPTAEFSEQQVQSLRVIPLNYGMPSPELFDLKLLADAAHRAILETGSKTLQYGGGKGKKRLTEWIVDHMLSQGILVNEPDILITNGSSQALELICKLFLNHGDEVWVESPSYFGSLNILSLYGARLTGMEIDVDGVIVDKIGLELERRRKAGEKLPRFIYVIPNFHNPTGYTMSVNRRKRLSELAMEYKVPIVEDDAYGQLLIDGELLPSIKSMSNSHTIYMSTFSKTIAPGLRLGWIAADESVINKIKLIKTDGGTNSLSIEVASNYLATIQFDEHIGKIRDVYRSKRDLMASSLIEYSANLHWTLPKGGFYIWVTLPDSIDSNKLLKIALKQNVNFVPGTSFFTNERDGAKYIRLCYSFCSNALIKMGIKRITESLKQYPNEVVIDEC